MRRDEPTFSRRSLLVAVGLVATGCTASRSGHHAAPVVDPDAAAVARARDGERVLLASYDAAIAAASALRRPALLAARATHAVHLAVLHGGGTPTSDVAVVSDLRGAELASATTLRSAATTATVGANAALLASIAASHGAAR